jgi:hypothetical protein
MPDFFSTYTRFTIVNDALYETLKDYVYDALHRDGIGVHYFVDESDSIGYRELSFEYSFGDDWVDCQPESLYDVLPCFLIFLGATLDWRPDQFSAFRKAILSKALDIESHFIRVDWESSHYTYRPDSDGTYDIAETFCYNMAKDETKHTRTTLRNCDTDFREHCKFHGYDWSRLDARSLY